MSATDDIALSWDTLRNLILPSLPSNNLPFWTSRLDAMGTALHTRFPDNEGMFTTKEIAAFVSDGASFKSFYMPKESLRNTLASLTKQALSKFATQPQGGSGGVNTASNQNNNNNSNNNNNAQTGFLTKEFDVQKFLSEPLPLPTFEPNGDHISMLGRERQVAKVFRTVNLINKNPAKLPIMVVSSTRGMGKTFFLKKLCRMNKGPFARPRKVGRIICLESSQAGPLLSGRDYELFWSRLIVWHLLNLFQDCTVNIGSQTHPQVVVFRAQSLKQIVENNGSSSLDLWISSVASKSTKEAIVVLENITNNMFNVESPCKPVFVLDNVHRILTKTDRWSSVAQEYCTQLSVILDYLTEARPICIVAGTDDGKIKLLSDRSNYYPTFIYMTVLGIQNWNAMGRDFTKYANKNSARQVVWGNIVSADEVARMSGVEPTYTDELVDEPIDEQTDGLGIDGLDTDGDTACESADGGLDTSCEDDDAEIIDSGNAGDEDKFLLLAMLYQTCQVPRLMRFAIESWIEGKQHRRLPSTISDNFEAATREHYTDEHNILTQYTPEEVAMIFLACSTHWPVTYYICGPDVEFKPAPSADPNQPKEPQIDPRERFSIRSLVHKAIIFPYRISSNEKRCCYVMPIVFWRRVNQAQQDLSITLLWFKARDELKKMVPGLSWTWLCPTFASVWLATLNLTQLGDIYEDIIAASLASKFRLLRQTKPDGTVLLTDIYDIDSKAQAYPLVSSIPIDLSGGIEFPATEATATTHRPAVQVNRNSPTAHFDMILPPPVQAKHSLTDPSGTDIAPQLEGTDCLLWFYLGCDEDHSDPPKKYRSPMVLSKMREHKLGFLSGAGCVSPLALDFLILMKKHVKAITARKQYENRLTRAAGEANSSKRAKCEQQPNQNENT